MEYRWHSLLRIIQRVIYVSRGCVFEPVALWSPKTLNSNHASTRQNKSQPIAQSTPSANPSTPKPIPAAAVTAGAAAWLTCDGATVAVTTLVPEVLVTTTLLPVVAAEADDAMDEATELALAELKVLCTVKLQRVSTSRTSLSLTLSSSSSSVSVSYCATQASQLGIKVFALVALQIHWSSALSLSLQDVSCDSVRGFARTMLVVAVACDGDDLGADLGALLRNIVLADVLSRDESGQGSGNSKLLEEHGEEQVKFIVWIGFGSESSKGGVLGLLVQLKICSIFL